MEERTNLGKLYVVATPIGNLEDITLRAIRILRKVSLIASEDTRRTRKLLAHFDIHTPLISYYKDQERVRSTVLLERLGQGLDVALVSDAGTPGISDPGNILLSRAYEENIQVIPVPGPSALAAILSVSPFPPVPFIFLGFLPARTSERLEIIKPLRTETRALAFFESPHRFREALADCLSALGERRVVFGRELTKVHEEIYTGTLTGLLETVRAREEMKGEIVALIAGAASQSKPASMDVRDILLWHKERTVLSLRDAVKKVAQELDLPRSQVYRIALEVWR